MIKKMSVEYFNKFLEEKLKRLSDVLAKKGSEYAPDEDRMANFNEGARIKGVTPEQVLDGFLLKHIVSFNDILNGIKNNRFPTEELLREKLTDIQAYFILFEAMVLQKVEFLELINNFTCA